MRVCQLHLHRLHLSHHVTLVLHEFVELLAFCGALRHLLSHFCHLYLVQDLLALFVPFLKNAFYDVLLKFGCVDGRVGSGNLGGDGDEIEEDPVAVEGRSLLAHGVAAITAQVTHGLDIREPGFAGNGQLLANIV